MPVVDRAALEDSPLADLHALASELGIDGFRRLRKSALVDAILEAHTGEAPAAAESSTDGDGDGDGDGAEAKPRRPRRSRARKPKAEDEESEATSEPEAAAETESEPAPEPPARGRSRRRRGGTAETEEPAAAAPADEDRTAEGVVELLGNGSGFLRTNPPEPSEGDVYISAAQVRRCELVSGDRVSGPVRQPRRSERYPSLVRVDTINGRAADEVAEGTHFDDLPASFPSQRLPLDGDEPTLKAIGWLTPLGRGSRAVITGSSQAGKTEALRRIAGALAGQDGLELTLVLAGVRAEEIAEWKAGPIEPACALTCAASPETLTQAIERAVETAKRLASRGGDAVVLLDTLDVLPPHVARRLLAAARDIVDGGSLTIVATATEPVGGETTIVALGRALTAARRFPALDLAESGTLRPELLVGDDGAEAIAKARAAALGLDD